MKIAAFHACEICPIGAATDLPRRDAYRLLIFQEEQLRFEGPSMIKAQIQQRIRAVGQNKSWKKALPAQDSPVQQRRIFHRVRLTGVGLKPLEEVSGSKLRRAIPANRSPKRSASVALCWACRLRGNSRKSRPMSPLGGNCARRKEARKPEPRPDSRTSADSEPVAASSRIEFASSLASFYYATPAAPLRQPHRAVTHGKVHASIAVTVRVFINDHFAGE